MTKKNPFLFFSLGTVKLFEPVSGEVPLFGVFHGFVGFLGFVPRPSTSVRDKLFYKALRFYEASYGRLWYELSVLYKQVEYAT